MAKIYLFLLTTFMIAGCATPTPVPSQNSKKTKTLYLVVHKDNSVEEITLREVKRMYLGKTRHWPNRLNVTRFDYPPAQQAFYEQVLEISMTDLIRYWNKQKITAGARRPFIVKRMKDLFPRMKKELGGIAYVTTSNIPKYLKVLGEFEISQ